MHLPAVRQSNLYCPYSSPNLLRAFAFRTLVPVVRSRVHFNMLLTLGEQTPRETGPVLEGELQAGRCRPSSERVPVARRAEAAQCWAPGVRQASPQKFFPLRSMVCSKML